MMKAMLSILFFCILLTGCQGIHLNNRSVVTYNENKAETYGTITNKPKSGDGNVAAEQFLKGFKQGLDLAIAKTPADAFVEVEKSKAFDCKDGNCSVIVGSRDVRHQQKVAKQLIDDGYVDKDEKPKEGELTVYQNLNDLQERCKVLRKFNVDETRCYIHHFVVKDGKLTEIEFRMIDFDGTEFVTTCVGCCTMPELAEVEE